MTTGAKVLLLGLVLLFILVSGYFLWAIVVGAIIGIALSWKAIRKWGW